MLAAGSVANSDGPEGALQALIEMMNTLTASPRRKGFPFRGMGEALRTSVQASRCKRGNVQILDLLSGPGRFPQKTQAGFHGGIVLEAVYGDSAGESVPAIVINELDDDTLKSESMQGIIRLFATHA